MIKVVLDTNVVISALFWKGVPHTIAEKGLKGSFVLVTSHEILKEIKDKLEGKFRFPTIDTAAFIDILVLNSEIVMPVEKLNVVSKDPTDNKIVECAIAGKVDYIISGDKHLLNIKGYEGARIISPTEFLKLIS
ncbi:MAG: PilT protein domain-containing protein [Parcubacteria group bacterium Gr01-1014_29]|nr:MAG: PilT protein domain-containing protein [Parcubacteria group bacterium Gr01-1014_29]